MPLQSSGQISITQIVGELYQVSPAANSNRSLAALTAAANNSDPCNGSSLPGSNAAPHAMSEFYNYDHRCTSGPTLISCGIMAGPFMDEREACEQGRFLCEVGEGKIVWTSGSDCCPRLGDTFYTDSSGSRVLDPGIWWPCNCESPSPILIGNRGEVVVTYPCEDIRRR